MIILETPDLYQDIQDFNRAVIPGVDRTEHGPSMPSLEEAHLGVKLVVEEVNELVDAMGLYISMTGELRFKQHSYRLEDAADAVVDGIVVLLGMALRLGLTRECFYELWNEVHRANMAKAGGPTREDGKRLKPPGWQPPAVGEIVTRHTRLHESTKLVEDLIG